MHLSLASVSDVAAYTYIETKQAQEDKELTAPLKAALKDELWAKDEPCWVSLEVHL